MELPQNYHALHYRERKIVRLLYVARQRGRCYYCHASLTGPAAAAVLAKPVNRARFPPHFFVWPVHLHHDHTTGLTIGAVHSYCNAVLWQYHHE